MSWADTAGRLAQGCLSAVGNTVTIGGYTGKGILRSPSESIFDGVVIVTDWMLELSQSDWPIISEGTAITVDGIDYLAREQSRLGTDQSTIFVALEPAAGNAPPLVMDGDFL